LPVQGTWIIRTSEGYCKRIEPARSAAEYAQYMQQKPMILGSKSAMAALLNVNCVLAPLREPSLKTGL
jgi:hypothetical protein